MRNGCGGLKAAKENAVHRNGERELSVAPELFDDAPVVATAKCRPDSPDSLAGSVPDGAYRTPPEVARLWRCKPETVVAFIRSGELAAINLARRTAKRPRWRI